MGNNELEVLYGRFARMGDLGALAEVFDRVAPDLARLAAKLVSDPSAADDLVQETFLTAMERPGTYDAKQPLTPWLVGILVNRSRSTRRTESRATDRDLLTERVVEGPQTEVARKEHQEAVTAAVGQLPESLRVVVEGKLAGIDSSHLASQLGISKGALRGRMHRALQVMRAALPPGLATGFAIVFIHSPGLARVRVRVLTEARLHPLAKTASGVGGALAIGSVWMTKSVIVTTGLALLALGIVLFKGSLTSSGSLTPHRPSSEVALEIDRGEDESSSEKLGAKPGATGAADRVEVELPEAAEEATIPSRTLSGVVLDHYDKAVPNAAVQVWSSTSRRTYGHECDSEVIADAKGRFTLTDLEERFAVSASTDSLFCSRGVESTDEAFVSAENVVIKLAPSETIRGVVRSLEGAPIADATVWGTFNKRQWDAPPMTEKPDAAGLKYWQEGMAVTTTLANGAYTLIGVWNDSVSVGVKKPLYLVSHQWHKANEGPLDFTLDPGLSIQGRVVDSKGNPAIGATIRVFPYFFNLNMVDRDVLTDANGRFELQCIREIPDYQVEDWGSSHSFAVIHEGHAVEVVQPIHPNRTGDASVYVALKTEHSISGRVVDGEGNGIEGAKLVVEGERDMSPGVSYGHRTTWEWAGDLSEQVSDKNGRFLFSKLYEGEYLLTARHPDDSNLFTKLTVQSDDADLVVSLDPENVTMAVITGVVSDAVTGAPVASFSVTPMIDDSGMSHDFENAEGEFRVTRDPTDLIQLHVSSEGYSQKILKAQRFQKGESTLSIELLPARELTLSIVDAKGSPIQGGSVQSLDGNGRPIMLAKSANIRSSQLAFVNGRITLTALPAELVSLVVTVPNCPPHEFSVDLTYPYNGEMQLVLEPVLPMRVDLFVVEKGRVDLEKLRKLKEGTLPREEWSQTQKSVLFPESPLLSAPVEITVLSPSEAVGLSATIEPTSEGSYSCEVSTSNGLTTSETSPLPALQLTLPRRVVRLRFKSEGYYDLERTIDLSNESESVASESIELVPVK